MKRFIDAGLQMPKPEQQISNADLLPLSKKIRHVGLVSDDS
jgi:hypothetical protein